MYVPAHFCSRKVSLTISPSSSLPPCSLKVLNAAATAQQEDEQVLEAHKRELPVEHALKVKPVAQVLEHACMSAPARVCAAAAVLRARGLSAKRHSRSLYLPHSPFAQLPEP